MTVLTAASSPLCGDAALITSLLYVSRRTGAPADLDGEVERILAMARPRNRSIGVTGVLLATPRYFAQVLEGSAANVESIMSSIRRDRRHTDIAVASIERVPERRFESWSMAQVPPTTALDVAFQVLADEHRRDERIVGSFIGLLQASAGTRSKASPGQRDPNFAAPT